MEGFTDLGYDYSMSNLILMVGGQILAIVMVFLVMNFGSGTITLPVEEIKKMVTARPIS